MSKFSSFARVTTLAALTTIAQPAAAAVTPFGQRVNDAIERGLEYLRQNQGGDGGIDDGEGGGTTGLAMLCFLEKRSGVDWNAPHLGYAGMDAADQDRVRRGINYCLSNVPGFTGDTPYSYSTGACLMAASLYLVTGGPDDVGAPLPVSQAVANAVNGLRGTQGNGGCNEGGWNYRGPQDSGDLSTAQFAMAGLSAASALRPDAAATLPNAVQFVSDAKNGDGGHKYRSCQGYASTSPMTASGIWTYRLAGLPTGDDRVQSAMRWLRDNYRYDSMVQINGWNSQYYYLWAAAKALEVTGDDGAGAPLYSEAIGGQRDPAADGYPEESRRWYYDFAYWLVTTQDGSGRWCTAAECWNRYSATAYSILVLERSLGGVCIVDDDDDGLCSTDDNCPDVPNPDQTDTDGDGVGDACDNCLNEPNRDQVDDDADAIGDACDDLVCAPDGLPDLCDGRDNDCDGQVDNGSDGAEPIAPGPCATGQAGICARGQRACLDGNVVCLPDAAPGVEVCNRRDDDCNGTIDDGLVNVCGVCGADPVETCNGLDDDCDGQTDDGELCPPSQVCLEGACRQPCDGNECSEAGQFCNREVGLCVEPCVGIDCEFGLTCDTTLNQCVDQCAGVVCPDATQRCFEGQCVENSCRATGCPDGAVCDGLECVPDPCANAMCATGEFCRGGQCIPSCAQVSCPLYEACVDGACVRDDCAGVRCADGEACRAGACVADPCMGITCGEGARCVDGVCAFDACSTTECPPGQVCTVATSGSTQCISQAPEDRPVIDPNGPDAGPSGETDGGPGGGNGGGGPRLDATVAPPSGADGGASGDPASTASGCACSSTGGGASAGLWLLGLAGLGVARRRRRA